MNKNEENNGFGQIFKQRGNKAKLAASVFLFIVGFIAFLLERSGSEDSLKFYMLSSVFLLFSWLIGQSVYRCFLLVEEVYHLHSRYQGSWKKASDAVFDYQNKTLLAFITATGILLSIILAFNSEYNFYLIRLFLLNSTIVPAFLVVSNLNQPPKIEHSRANEKENKNLADGLAWNLYFGYLKFVLPNLRTQINRTEKYRHHSDFKIQKLFILIPKNCVIYDTISNKHTDPKHLIEMDGNLQPLKINRGGVHNRVYKNTVHCITDETTEEKHYCIMEYATNLQTLYDMSNDERAGLTREEKEIQVTLFVSKLKEILDGDENCKGKYELIPFGGDQDISKVMIRALKDCCVDIESL